MIWIEDIFKPEERTWESFYRTRWAYDKKVRSTHGVNCTGSCSWDVYVKNGIVVWELQALDYPVIDRHIPPYEPRGCQRGISYSWYLYSPIRIKYPYIRGALLDLWRAAKKQYPADPVAAWASIVTDPQKRKEYHKARGKGGFRRISWDEASELIAAANIYTVKRYGPDRIIGFSPIPAMSMVSYAAGARFCQLMGGVSLSFYDWYCDLPPASPEIWGEQTDVAESADWFHSKFIACVGSNVLMTRTPDAHFLVEARHSGAKVVVFSPDFSQTSKVADEWIPLHQGSDGAFWMAVGHIILKEYYAERKVDSFIQYLRQYSDAPFLVVVEKQGNGKYYPGKLLRASQIESTRNIENAEWKFFVIDETSGEFKILKGNVGHRWQKRTGEWNLKLEDSLTGAPVVPLLEIKGREDTTVPVEIPDFSDGGNRRTFSRHIPVKRVRTVDGEVYVTTVMELYYAQYGVNRGFEGDYPRSYDDSEQPFTPGWQEKFTGVSAKTVINFAREWARTAEQTGGKCSVIIGAGVNHWYHNNLIYRAVINALIFCGCVGKNGGGWNHYVGQEKLAPQASWAPIAFGADWAGPPRQQNTPSFHYIHSDQWRYDRSFNEMCPIRDAGLPMASGHTADKQALAVRLGWLPCYPQFNRSNFEIIKEAQAAGARSDEEIIAYVVRELKERRLKFAMEDPDNPECFPRVWYIWRGNAIMSSAKGHEYFLKHYLGTHHNAIAEQVAGSEIKEVVWRDVIEQGKMDLIVDVNFRMDTSALYSDIVLPAATYYEKDDLNTTDLHSYIHPLQAAVPPCWESKSDWQVFRTLAYATANLAKRYIPEPVKDILVFPLMHDTPAEIAQVSIKDWAKGECEAIPGKTMPNIKIITRDYVNLYNRFISLGPNFRNNGLSMHGIHIEISDLYDEYLRTHPVEKWGGKIYPSLKEDRDVCEAILYFAPETNGEVAYRAYEHESIKTGINLLPLAEKSRAIRYSFEDIATQPRRLLTTPCWSGITLGSRTYSAYCQNIEQLIPFRTLTGRQHLYIDHEAYIAFGENLPTFKPRAELRQTQDLDKSLNGKDGIVLNYLTPHGKWHIHSTYGDTLRMKTLSRGCWPVWINDKDAQIIGIEDNDWVEMYNDHGVVCTRAIVSARIPRGICLLYHSPERTVGVPKSPQRGMRRAGGHNSLTRVRLKPLFMVGGYGQFTYAFNYWGPQGVNRDTYVVVKKLTKVIY
ncbi:MAG: nitrate reductase subunit alpha [Verrucomicrobiia bacterium]